MKVCEEHPNGDGTSSLYTVDAHEPAVSAEPVKQLIDPLSLLTPTERARLERAQVYKGTDLHALHEAGRVRVRPWGPRLLMRAILAEDAHGIGAGIGYDARKAIAHEVLDIGGGVQMFLDRMGVPDDARAPRTWMRRLRTWLSGRGVQHSARPMIGDHVFILSTAADRMSKTDRTCRLWFCHVEDASGGWHVTQ